MTSHPDSHTTTDVKPDMLSGVQTGNGIPHDNMIYEALHIYACTNRKDDIYENKKYLRLNVGNC